MDTDHYRTVKRDPDAPNWNNCPRCGQTGTKLGETARDSTVYECPDCPVREFEVFASSE